jgi:hypothetical protein
MSQTGEGQLTLQDNAAGLVDDTQALLGAFEIVESFTALRQELKLQVRNGRELQQLLIDGQKRSDEGRKLAEAIAEIDESIRRIQSAFHATEAMQNLRSSSLAKIKSIPVTHSIQQTINHQIDQSFAKTLTNAPWWMRMFGKSFLQRLQLSVQRDTAQAAIDRLQTYLPEDSDGPSTTDIAIKSICNSLDLLVRRLERLMEQCKLERVEVFGKPFDADYMNAIDAIASTDVPENHVAEQVRPAYRWQGTIVRHAEVRVSKSNL